MLHGIKGEAHGKADERTVAAERLKQYAIAAGAVVTAVGGATGASYAAVVTSTGSGPVWSNTLGARNNNLFTFTIQTSFLSANALGDPVLAPINVRLVQGRKAFAAPQNGSFYRLGNIQFLYNAGGVGNGRLAAGATVGAGSAFQALGGMARSFAQVGGNVASTTATNPTAPWSDRTADGWDFTGGNNSVRGYLAFRIASGSSDFYYGYLDLEYVRTGVNDTSTFTMTIHGWAYESTLNQSITIGGAAAVPGGAGLAALAFGAAGLRGRRRSRN